MGKDVLWMSAWYAICVSWLVSLTMWLTPVPYGWLWLLLGYALADAGSYFFHYIIDHYGDPGRTGLVREFQFHHLEPWGIARKSLTVVILPAARIITPVLLLLLVVTLMGGLPVWFGLLGFELGALWVFTQALHRWAHMPTRGVVRLAQRLHLIIDAPSHRHHHSAPFHSHFAVINGWSNWPLDRLGAPALVDRLLGALGYRKHGLEKSLEKLMRSQDLDSGTLSTQARS